MSRTQSSKAEKAEKMLRKKPDISGADLARHTGLNITTIYRAKWWKDRPAKDAKEQA